ncbi:MAG: hypothetical protein GX042_02885 [Bacteroidales bacterium]|jgi:hypothetical protein|nr:hypothetical protein [Bacteroidales bacterium]
MKLAGIIVSLFVTFCTVDVHCQNIYAQQLPDSTLHQTADTVTAVPPDTVPLNRFNDSRGELQRESTRVTVDSIFNASSSDNFFAPTAIFKPTPRKAVIYSAIFPGLGQVYNRKYWKLPILYGGFVGFTYAITWNNGYYRDYLGGYQDIMDDNPDTNRWHKMLPYGRDPETIDVKWFTDVLQKRKDYYRYYRDLSVIGTVALYMIAMVDAYVDAQLFDFDMSPDLSMRVEPSIIKEGYPGFNNSSSYGLQLSFNF